MKTDEIRERFLKFYEARGHARYPSDSLVPSNDPSLLFTSAGMAQFKDMFLGIGKLPHKRIATCQRCLRVGDLENVGRTARHHTFFEMLGNFSFGDYFKAEAIPWCWEFYTGDLGIPAEKLWVSIYEKDDEAEAAWKKLGKLKHPIVKMGEADNFWPANAPSQGPNGPCGPCSEIFYDFGKGDWWCGKCEEPGHSCDRFVEIGNIVFTQYERQEGGVLKPLPQKNIDFGGGLERVAAVMQGVHSNYEIDIFKAIIAEAEKVLGVRADARVARRFRRIADHIRALTFCIADGAIPDRTGRGYVVRRILRTAFRDGVWIRAGADDPFLYKLVPGVLGQMKSAYPHLIERRTTIEDIIRNEESQFRTTLQRGTIRLGELIEKVPEGQVLPGRASFDLYQSHGLPFELQKELVAEYWPKKGLDEEGFYKELKAEQDRGRTSEAIFDPNSPLTKVKEQKVPVSEFLGYGIRVADIGKPVDVRILGIVRLDPEALAKFNESKKDMAQVTKLIGRGTLVDSAKEGDPVAVLCDRTPFYADGGGQIGDAGWVRTSDAEVEISDGRKPDGYYFHLGRVAKGTLRPGPATAQVDAPRRLDIMRNHTGTHLLHAALRAVLGPHVTQAGSVVEPHRLRFDFTHPKALTRAEIRAIEDWVNGVIFEDAEVVKAEMPMEEAKAKGALMFFGDKYGDRVRVVTVGSAKSVELCGGTHLERASTIGQLRITSESAIGSGVRRVEAVTGRGAVEIARKQEDLLADLARELGCPVADLPRRIRQIAKDVQELKSEVGKLRKGTPAREPGSIIFEKDSDSGIWRLVWTQDLKANELRELSDREFAKPKGKRPEVAFIGSTSGSFLIRTAEDSSKTLNAKELLEKAKEFLPIKGGGNSTLAQGVIANPPQKDQIPEALQALEVWIGKVVS
ncbi:MAG TPA: alanine--tRNA ligase [Thermoanaerobaculia bacterium]